MKIKLLLSLIAFSLIGCESIKEAWNDTNRAATIAKLQSSAIKVLGRAAVMLLQSQISGSNPDFGHAAADAVWRSVDIEDISEAVRAAGGSSALAKTAENIAIKAEASEPVDAEIIKAVADAISSGALKEDVRRTGLRHD